MLSGIVIAYAQSMTDPTVVDVAVYYTPSAREVAGGTDLVKAEIDAAVAGTNQAFTDGGLNLQVSLVLVTEVAQAPNRGGLDLYYGLAAPSDGFLDEVHHGRDQAAADLIVLAHGGSSGRACLLSRRSGDTDCAIAVVPLGDVVAEDSPTNWVTSWAFGTTVSRCIQELSTIIPLRFLPMPMAM